MMAEVGEGCGKPALGACHLATPCELCVRAVADSDGAV